MLAFATFILVCATLCMAAESLPCFAFLLKGDVVVSCEGRKFPVAHTDEIIRFAISEEAATLRLTYSTVNQNYRATEVNLQSGFVRAIPVSFGPEAPSNVSPDGAVTVSFDGRGLCVAVHSELPTCISVRQESPDLPFVTNSGAVVLAQTLSRECFYKSRANFSPRKFAGATLENADACVAIALWKPGWTAPKIIEPLGRNPRWITPKTADLLRRQAARNPKR